MKVRVKTPNELGYLDSINSINPPRIWVPAMNKCMGQVHEVVSEKTFSGQKFYRIYVGNNEHCVFHNSWVEVLEENGEVIYES